MPNQTETRRARARYNARRRMFISWGLRGSLALGGLTAVGKLAFEAVTAPKNEEEKLELFIDDFEAVSRKLPQARELYNEFVQRVRLGWVENGEVKTKEVIDPSENFVAAIVDENEDKELFDSLPGFAAFGINVKSLLPCLLIPDKRLGSFWRGVLLAHEAVHVDQWFKGLDKLRTDPFGEGK